MLLRAGRWTVTGLAAELGVGWRTVYRLLRAAERAGVVLEVTREGKERYYRVEAESLRRLLSL